MPCRSYSTQGLERSAAERVHVGEAELEVFARGVGGGEPIVLLHDLDYLNGLEYAFIEGLARTRRVVAPSHPGFGASLLPEGADSIEDLAYIYLDWLHSLGSVHLVGAGFGGWIAAEVAVRCTHNLRSLTLVDALGIKVSGAATADIKDMFVLSPRELVEACWHAPALGEQLMPLPTAGTGLDEDTLTLLLSNRRTAALMGWNPFMHNPKLRGHLRRIDVPTLVVWGASDRLVTPAYGRAYADAIPNARFHLIDEAGHYPYLEKPAEFLSVLEALLAT